MDGAKTAACCEANGPLLMTGRKGKGRVMKRMTTRTRVLKYVEAVAVTKLALFDKVIERIVDR